MGFNSAFRGLRMITVQLTIMVYGEQDTIMSFIRCTMNWTQLKCKNKKTDVAGTPL
jgi:hypothetical protein